MALAKLGRALPSFGSFLFQVSEFIDIGDVVHSATMQIDHFQHRIDIVLRHRFRNAAAPRIVITWKWAHRLRQPRALFVRFAGHDRRDGAAQRAPLHAVVSVSVTHDQRSQIRVTEPERPENVRVLRDFSDGVAGIIDYDFLRGDEDAHRRFESLDIEHAVCCFEFQQIERREIACGVVEEEVLAARIRRILPAGAFAGVPFVNGGIELHPGIAADVCALGDFSQKRACLFALARPSVRYAARPPFVCFQRCVHEFVAYAHTQIFVLIHDRAVGVTVVTAVVTLLDQRPGFFLFLLLRVDKLLDVRVPIFQRVHLRRAPGFAAALHHVGDLIVNFQK